MHRTIRTVDDVLDMLDRLFAADADRWTRDAASWWDDFYADRGKPVPFFVPKPDENLGSYLDRGLLAPGGLSSWAAGPAATRSISPRAVSRWMPSIFRPPPWPGPRNAPGRRARRSGSTARTSSRPRCRPAHMASSTTPAACTTCRRTAV